MLSFMFVVFNNKLFLFFFRKRGWGRKEIVFFCWINILCLVWPIESNRIQSKIESLVPIASSYFSFFFLGKLNNSITFLRDRFFSAIHQNNMTQSRQNELSPYLRWKIDDSADPSSFFPNKCIALIIVGKTAKASSWNGIFIRRSTLNIWQSKFNLFFISWFYLTFQ